MGSLIDLTGKRFGMLVVKERCLDPALQTGFSPVWLCKCDCGKYVVIRGGDLRYRTDGGMTKTDCGCQSAKRQPGDTLMDSFLRKVDRSSSQCWLWLGTTAHGYGVFHIQKYPSLKRAVAHIWIYEYSHGPVPRGMELHHKCENRICVNPDHLELKTRSAHTKLHASKSRKTHCFRGHPLSGDNLRIQVRANGKVQRVCKACHSLSMLDADIEARNLRNPEMSIWALTEHPLLSALLAYYATSLGFNLSDRIG